MARPFQNLATNPFRHAPRALARGALLLSALSLAGGCTFAVDVSGLQCQSDADCTSLGAGYEGARCEANECRRQALRGEGAEGDWACVGRVRYEAPAGPEATVRLDLVDLITSTPVTGFRAYACRKADLDCASPIAGGEFDDPSGRLELRVPTYDAATMLNGFNGYLQIEAEGYMPLLYFSNPPVMGDQQQQVPLVPRELFGGLTQSTGLSGLAPGRGAINLIALDCDDAQAADVHFELESRGDALTYYLIEGASSGRAADTDRSGIGGFINVAPGFHVARAFRAESGDEIARASVLVREGFITYSPMSPTPL
ncbi:MAG TPA: hypothetical protein VFS00_11175 [Polyangiaceae bacterium]|nr:hypothetical protein [Polyangiaceae bacterium]